MALLDSISLYSNLTTIGKWANGKYGEIHPNKKNEYEFWEYEMVNGEAKEKYHYTQREEKSIVLTYGFVSFWLMHRKRKTERAHRMDLFVPEDRYKNPVDIFKSYIESLKKAAYNWLQERPDAWRYPDFDKYFYTRVLGRESEETLIKMSYPLLEYLDEEDKEEFNDVMTNYLDYVSYIVEPYQSVVVDPSVKCPDPKRKIDNNDYTIDSPEIESHARKLTELQALILERLIENNGKIKVWQEDAKLREYTQQEMWDACCLIFEDDLIQTVMKSGNITTTIAIRDKGKLVLRKYRSLPQHEENDIPEEYRTSVESVFIKKFNDVMNPWGFYDIPKIKKLSKNKQYEFVLKLYKEKIPAKVALFDVIEFMEYMENEKGIKDQSKRLRIIEQALGITENNRELKGNFNILDPKSHENATKFTVFKHIDDAKAFYSSLLA